MRIVIDLQGAQTESRYRGIGRYSLALAQAMARNAGEHEIWIVLNGAFQDSVFTIRRVLCDLVPKERICVFDVPAPTAQVGADNAWRARAAEKIREHFIRELRPDRVLVTSLFEGYIDDGVTSVGTFCDGRDTAVILYDLIPLLNPDAYLATPQQRCYYERKIQSLRNAGLLLAISDYSRQEAIAALQLDPDTVVSISSAVEPHFRPADLSEQETAALRQRFGITRKMVLCAPGGFDARKNIDGLIAGYGLLPAALRAEHQLVLASRLDETERQKLDGMAQRAGLKADELVLTGYVTNADLIALYSSTTLFVYPSKHEGFGLPALEAMACGAPVIGSNSTSIPEVVGHNDALFDAHSPRAIADKLEQVLRSEELLSRLRQHGLAQAGKFSWDASAKRALVALAAHVRAAEPSPMPDSLRASPDKPRLAFVSPLPPERTGIANYSMELLPALLDYFDIELIIDQAEVSLPPSLSALVRRSVTWFTANGHTYDRIVYQFGNSPFHSHMLVLLRRFPGVVVLHDFYLSGLLAYDELTGRLPGAWTQALYHSHGYSAVVARFRDEGIEDAKNAYPANLEVLQNARGVVVHSAYSQKLARMWYGTHAADDWKVVPHLRTATTAIDRRSSRQALGIGEDAFVVCSFGFIDPTKLSRRLLEAWLSSCLASEQNCLLILVGQNHGGDYGAQLAERIYNSAQRDRVRITGWTDEDIYYRYLQAADVGVQLRTSSRGETSGAVLHCLNFGLPTIVNANGAMADLPEHVVFKLPDAFADSELIVALESLWANRDKRSALEAAARHHIQMCHDPKQCAWRYAEAIEAFYADASSDLHALLRSIAAIPGLPRDEAELQQIAQSVAASSSERLRLRQLLVDVSTICRNDLQTGIERVVRAQVFALVQNPPPDFRIEPVYLSNDGGTWNYRHARKYAGRLLGFDAAWLDDSPVDIGAGDIFYAPDFYPDGVIAAAQSGLYARWRALGVEVNFLIYDLLPVLKPEFFPEQADRLHGRWLDCVAENADRLICISTAVAADLTQYLSRQEHDQPGRVEIAVNHLGADIGASVPSTGVPIGAERLLEQLGAAPSFLMVGTIEPRKGHLQTLAAFEHLWREGVRANLVIVGKEGWTALPLEQRRTIPAIVERLRHHPEREKQLFWLHGISDEYLQKIYAACTCLIFASEGEGFGLPLIEAARHHLPIIVRDLPVFRELAEHHASYFTGLSAADLAAAVRAWLVLHARGAAPASASIPWLTWTENVAELTAILTGGRAALDHQKLLTPP